MSRKERAGVYAILPVFWLYMRLARLPDDMRRILRDAHY